MYAYFRYNAYWVNGGDEFILVGHGLNLKDLLLAQSNLRII